MPDATSPLQVTMYIYAAKIPVKELTLLNCIKCRRSLFKAATDKIVISNAYGASFRDLPPATNYIEHQCHSCKTLYQIMFQ